MGCGCGNSATTVWVYTDPTGKTIEYSKQIEAQVAKIRAGGGNITTRQKG